MITIDGKEQPYKYIPYPKWVKERIVYSEEAHKELSPEDFEKIKKIKKKKVK